MSDPGSPPAQPPNPLTVQDLERLYISFEGELAGLLADLGIPEDYRLDIVSDIFQRLVARVRDGEEIKVENERNYLRQAARQSASAYFEARALSRKVMAGSIDADGPSSTVMAESQPGSDYMPASNAPRPISVLTKQEDLERAKSVFYNHLNPEEREILELHDRDNLTLPEIASRLHLTLDQVQRRLLDSRNHFRDVLGQADSAMVRKANQRDWKPTAPQGVLEAINRLPQPYRGFLIQFHFEKKAAEVIARSEGTSNQEIEARLSRGHELLEQSSHLTAADVRKIISEYGQKGTQP